MLQIRRATLSSILSAPSTLLTLSGALACAAAPAFAADSVLVRGDFQVKDAALQVKGGFEVVATDAGVELRMEEGFAVSSGPDLYFTFSPMAAEALTDGNAKDGALKVEPRLKSLSGAQTYALPEDFSAEAYRSLAIHCWNFSHLYAAADLDAPSSASLKPAKRRSPERAALDRLMLNRAWSGRGPLSPSRFPGVSRPFRDALGKACHPSRFAPKPSSASRRGSR